MVGKFNNHITLQGGNGGQSPQEVSEDKVKLINFYSDIGLSDTNHQSDVNQTFYEGLVAHRSFWQPREIREAHYTVNQSYNIERTGNLDNGRMLVCLCEEAESTIDFSNVYGSAVFTLFKTTYPPKTVNIVANGRTIIGGTRLELPFTPVYVVVTSESTIYTSIPMIA